ncbi:MAG: hypothetical protein FWE03_00675 [Firmicutes bacterium]|nr:hypothetical protein [Bacillota bacterium]
MQKRRIFLALEKKLLNKNKENKENEVVLEEADFKDEKLSWAGYNRLKNECEYIDYSDQIEIKIPQRYDADFKNCLENMAANELSKIKKDKIEARIKASILFFIGIIILTIGLVWINEANVVRQEFTLIISWVFIWAAAEKLFFDRRDLQNNRYNLLHILTAKINTY